MSRIHDAIKKAELERAGAAPEDATAVLLDPHANRPNAERRGMPSLAAGVLTQPRSAEVSREEPVLQFSEVVERCAHPDWRFDPRTNIFSDGEPSINGTEQFRTLRSRLYQLRNDQSLRTVLVTSALSGEGKTFVSGNLAQAIVRQHERRALLIDGDLRRSRLHLAIGAPNSPGLSDFLRGDADLLSVIQHGNHGNLCFIPGGNEPTNPSELLANGRMKILLDRVSPAFDWILIDSPPCLPVADANILADMCDGILLIVRAQSTPAAAVAKAGRELRGRNVVGVVMNGVDERARGYDYYYRSGDKKNHNENVA